MGGRGSRTSGSVDNVVCVPCYHRMVGESGSPNPQLVRRHSKRHDDSDRESLPISWIVVVLPACSLGNDHCSRSLPPVEASHWSCCRLHCCRYAAASSCREHRPSQTTCRHHRELLAVDRSQDASASQLPCVVPLGLCSALAPSLLSIATSITYCQMASSPRTRAETSCFAPCKRQRNAMQRAQGSGSGFHDHGQSLFDRRGVTDAAGERRFFVIG